MASAIHGMTLHPDHYIGDSGSLFGAGNPAPKFNDEALLLYLQLRVLKPLPPTTNPSAANKLMSDYQFAALAQAYTKYRKNLAARPKVFSIIGLHWRGITFMELMGWIKPVPSDPLLRETIVNPDLLPKDPDWNLVAEAMNNASIDTRMIRKEGKSLGERSLPASYAAAERFLIFYNTVLGETFLAPELTKTFFHWNNKIIAMGWVKKERKGVYQKLHTGVKTWDDFEESYIKMPRRLATASLYDDILAKRKKVLDTPS